MSVVGLLYVGAEGTDRLRPYQDKERGRRHDFSPPSIRGRRYFVPVRLVYHVGDEHASLFLAVRFGIQRIEQLWRELPKAVTAVIVGRQRMKYLPTDGAQRRHISERLRDVVNVLERAKVDHCVVGLV